MRLRKFSPIALILTGLGSPAAAQMHGGDPVEVPLQVRSGLLLVSGETPDGTVFEFILSTGSAVTMFSESGAARLGNRSGLTIGGVPVPMEDRSIVPDESLSADGKVFDGVIGPNMLNEFDVLIDVPGERLVLKPFGRSVAWDGMRMSDPIRLRVYHGVVLGLDVEFNGKEYMAMLDLARTTLVVNERVMTETHIDEEDVGALRLGSTTFSDLPVRMRDLEMFKMWAPNGEGFVVVAAPVAYDCAISISWIHREMRTCVR